jgi:hypothetical protein
MSKLKTLTDAESAVLTPLLAQGQPLAGASLVVEDTQDLNAEILKSMSDIGLMILLGVPSFDNSRDNSGSKVAAGISQQILVGEVPAVWRNAADTNVHCQDAARIVAAALQGLLLPNHQRLRVVFGMPLGTFKGEFKKSESVFQYYRLELETNMTFDAT